MTSNCSSECNSPESNSSSRDSSEYGSSEPNSTSDTSGGNGSSWHPENLGNKILKGKCSRDNGCFEYLLRVC